MYTNARVLDPSDEARHTGLTQLTRTCKVVRHMPVKKGGPTLTPTLALTPTLTLIQADFTEVGVARFTSYATPQAVNGRLDSTLVFSGSCG